MTVLYLITLLLLGASLAANRRRTGRALRVAGKRLLKILPAFGVMLVLIAVALYLLPDHLLLRAFSHENRWGSVVAALGIGSISVMPGFIAFPLCGLLHDKGALYMALAAFASTLMMVGVVTFPLEKTYLGARLALLRNVVALAIAVAVVLATGVLFGELP